MLATNKIYNVDFRKGLEFIEEDYIIVTDPPYNINYNYDEYNDNLSDEEYIRLISNLKDKRLAIIHYPEETMKYFVPALGVPDEVGIWAYNSNLPNRHSRLINYYNINPDYNKVLQPYKNPNDKRIKERIKSGKLGARSYDWFSDIQLVKNVSKNDFNHPCPVPVQLMERIILLTSNVGDLIVDPFMGSGTTGVACMRTGRRYIGFEISEEYCQMAQDRIKKLEEEVEE